jgi:DNA-binding CsgD family transcriptional regulator
MKFDGTGATVEELRAVLARIDTAVLTVDRSLRLYFANPAGQALIRRGDGLRLTGDRLSTQKTSDTRVLAAAVGDPPPRIPPSVKPAAMRDSNENNQMSTVVSVWRGDETGAYRVVVFPLRSVNPVSAEAVLFVDTITEENEEGEALLFQKSFDLTRAEARLAVHLMAGASLTEAAEKFGVTHNTVRSQLKAVFEKTHVRRQADLVRLLQSHRSLRLSLN